MKLLFFVGLVCSAAQAVAAPFVVCDPYPDTGPQPTEFVIAISGQATPVVIPAAIGPEGAFMKWDVAGVRGTQIITVKARNAWGESAESLPFAFNGGVPAVASGFRIVP